MPALVVGLLSDTHVPRRIKRLPKTVLDALAGVDLILHAGDVDDPAALEPLRAIAPVHAVRGNVHLHEFSGGGTAPFARGVYDGNPKELNLDRRQVDLFDHFAHEAQELAARQALVLNISANLADAVFQATLAQVP